MARKPRRTMQENYDRLVIKAEGDQCWGWSGSVDKDGYGVVDDGGFPMRAHRASYEIHVGEIPPKKKVCHTCDNPPCSNPAHLFVSTQRGNMQDRNRKGRHAPTHGMNHGAHKLTDDQVLAIRATQAVYATLAAQYGVSPATICMIKKRNRWKHLP